MKERIAKLEAEVDALHKLTLYAYERFTFLRPMLADGELLDRIRKESKGIGFGLLRGWLYWGLVHELSKICYDGCPKSPSIDGITRKLEDLQLRGELEKKFVSDHYMKETEARACFNDAYAEYDRVAKEMLASRSVGSYRTIRDKLTAHNELRWSPSGYDFFDLKNVDLEIGDERKLLRRCGS